MKKLIKNKKGSAQIIVGIIALIVIVSLFTDFIPTGSINGWQEQGVYSERAQNSVISDQRNCGGSCDSKDESIQKGKLNIFEDQGYSDCYVWQTSDHRGNGRMIAYCNECPADKTKVMTDSKQTAKCEGSTTNGDDNGDDNGETDQPRLFLEEEISGLWKFILDIFDTLMFWN